MASSSDVFLRSIENAFWYFSGVRRRLVLDNLLGVVKKADWFEPEQNSKVEAFAADNGIAFAPTRPCLPRLRSGAAFPSSGS